MAISTKVGLINEIDKLIDNTQANQETSGLLRGLYSIIQQVDRSFVRETNFKVKISGKGQTPTTKMPPNYVPTAAELAEIEKKRTSPPAPPVEIKQDDLAPATAETKPQPNEAELLDIVAAGIEKIKADYKTPKEFAKKLKAIGVEAKGKTHDELFAAAKVIFDEASA